MHIPHRHRLGLLAATTIAALAAVPGPRVLAQQVGTAVPRNGAPAATPAQAPVTYALQLTGARLEALLDANRRKLNYVPGEVLVKFKPGVSTAGAQRALMALRSRPSTDSLGWLGDVALLRDETQPDAAVLAQQLSEQPEVEYAEPNYLRRLTPHRVRAVPVATGAHLFGTPNDRDFSLLQWNFPLIGMPKAWDINAGGKTDLIVAVVDTGLTTARQTVTYPLWTGSAFQTVNLPFDVSPDLPVSRIVSPQDFIFLTNTSTVLDFDGHGTHVASTLAEATNNTIGLAGIAYNVKVMPVKVCVGYWELMIAQAQAGKPGFLPADSSSCPDNAIASGIRYAADHGARVINMSLGGDAPSTTIQDAIKYAVQHGVFMAVPMGNDFEDGNPKQYPASYAPDIDGLMSVAAIGKSETHAYYSGTGSYCEIAAPGGSDRDGGGADSGVVWQTTLLFTDQDPGVIVPRFDRYAEVGYTGTSMATPHVAGVAALLMSQGALSPATVESQIKKSAKDLGAPGKDDQFGFGLVQARAALFGFGIVR
jgi:serine protease